MTLKINSVAPDFTAQTQMGEIKFHEWLGDSWGVLFSHPKDFTPVCTTELGALARMKPDFDARNVKVMGLSVDPVSDHEKWLEDITDVCGMKPEYPIVADEKLEVAKLYNMLEGDAGTTSMGRTAVDNETVRTVYIVRPDKRIGLFLTYPMTTGRNFAEILRAIDSMQRTAKHKIATPADWKPGEDVIIVPKVTNEEAKKIYPDGWETIKPYLRKVPDPQKVKLDTKLLNQQSQHWEKNFSNKPEMFGLEASEPAKKSLKIFQENNINTIIELGAGLGRDSIYFSINNLSVTSLDYSQSGINIINKKINKDKLKNIKTKVFDIRQKLPFEDNSIDGCFSHMLYCMALSNQNLFNLNKEICRILKPDGLNIYTVRNEHDGDYKNGIHRGEDMYENDGFIVHFLTKQK